MSYALLKFGTVYNLLEAGARRVASAKGAKSKHSFDIQVSTLHTSGMNAIVSRSLMASELNACRQTGHLQLAATRPPSKVTWKEVCPDKTASALLRSSQLYSESNHWKVPLLSLCSDMHKRFFPALAHKCMCYCCEQIVKGHSYILTPGQLSMTVCHGQQGGDLCNM